MPALHQTSIKETKRDQRDQKQHTRKVTEFHQGFWVETGDRTQVVQAKQSRLGATKFTIKTKTVSIKHHCLTQILHFKT